MQARSQSVVIVYDGTSVLPTEQEDEPMYGPELNAIRTYESLTALCLDITGAASSCPSIAQYGTALSMLRLSLSC